MSTSSRAAIARSARTERLPVALVGLVATAAGAGALVLGRTWPHRPVADPAVLEWLRGDHSVAARAGALALGVLLVVFGLCWAARSVRPEPRPDLVFDDPDGPLRITADAIAGAIRADAQAVDGVGDARARVVRAKGAPAVRLQLGLADGADLGAVWRQLDDRVVDRARRSLGVDALPTAVRLDARMEPRSAARQRVR